MLEITLPMTAIFARIYGVYALAAGIGLLVSGTRYQQAMAGFRDNAALTYLAAILAFAVGAVTVTLHNVWSGAPAIIVSFIGWAALVEGVIFLILPAPVMDVAARMIQSKAVVLVFAVIAIVLGLFLLIAGFSA